MDQDPGGADRSVDDDEVQADLFVRARTDPAAKEAIVVRYRSLVEYLAKRFQGRGESIEDLIQVASLGLLKAIDRFDPDRGVRFSTYASATIVGEIKRHFRDTGWSVHVPRRMQEVGLQVSRSVSELFQQLGRSPTVPEIAAATGLSEEDVLEGLEIAGVYRASSLDAATDEGRSSIPEPSFDEEAFETMEGWATVAAKVRGLPHRERLILYLRFFKNRTQTEIAEEVGISQMHVSRLLARTLAQLHDELDQPEPDRASEG